MPWCHHFVRYDTQLKLYHMSIEHTKIWLPIFTLYAGLVFFTRIMISMLLDLVIDLRAILAFSIIALVISFLIVLGGYLKKLSILRSHHFPSSWVSFTPSTLSLRIVHLVGEILQVLQHLSP